MRPTRNRFFMLAALLYGLRVAILVAHGFGQYEMVSTKKALEDAGAIVHIVSPINGKVQGWDWYLLDPQDYFEVDVPLSRANANDYDALFLPGGINSLDRLRLEDNAVSFVKGFQNKPIAAICHGPWVLISAELIENKSVTAWPSIKIDLINAGAKWVDKEIVRDANILTGCTPNNIPAFNEAVLKLFEQSLAQRNFKFN